MSWEEFTITNRFGPTLQNEVLETISLVLNRFQSGTRCIKKNNLYSRCNKDVNLCHVIPEVRDLAHSRRSSTSLALPSSSRAPPPRTQLRQTTNLSQRLLSYLTQRYKGGIRVLTTKLDYAYTVPTKRVLLWKINSTRDVSLFFIAIT